MNSIQGSSMTNPEILHTFNDLVNRKDWKGLDTFLSLPELRSLLPKELVQEFKALIESKVGMETEANLRRTIQLIKDSIRSVREHSPDEKARSNIISTDELLKIVLTRDIEKLRSFVDQNQIPDNFITSVKDFMNSPENAKKDADKEHHRDRNKARAKPSIAREESPESTDEYLLIPSKGSSSRRKRSKSHYQTSLTEEGDITNLRFLIEKKGIKPNDMVLKRCIHGGDWELLKMLTKYPEIKITYSTLEEAARYGQLDMVKFFIQDYSLIPDKRILDDAAYGGNVNLVKYLIQTYRLFPDITTLHMAVRSNDLEMTKFLVEKRNLVPDEQAAFFAWNDHNMDLYTYLIESREQMRSNHNEFGSNKMMKKELSEAARIGNLEFVRFLILEKGYKADQGTLKEATKSGNVPLVQYLTIVTDIEPDLECLRISLERGHLEIAKHYIETYNLVATKEMLDAAALNGRRDIIEYLSHDLKIMPDIVTLNEAVSKGKYDTAKYLMETLQITPDQTTKNYANLYGSLPLQKLVSRYHNKDLISESIQKAVSNDNHAEDPKEIIKNRVRRPMVFDFDEHSPRRRRPASTERRISKKAYAIQRSNSWDASFRRSSGSGNSIFDMSFSELELSDSINQKKEEVNIRNQNLGVVETLEDSVIVEKPKSDPFLRSKSKRISKSVSPNLRGANRKKIGRSHSFKLNHGKKLTADRIYHLKPLQKVPKQQKERRLKSTRDDDQSPEPKKHTSSHQKRKSKVDRRDSPSEKASVFQKPKLLRHPSDSSLKPISDGGLEKASPVGSPDDSIEVKKPKSELSLGKFFKKTKKSDDYGNLDDDSLESDF